MRTFRFFLRRGLQWGLALALLGGCTSADMSPSPSDIGQAGSRSRLAILGSTLYTVDNQNLRVFDLGTASTSGQPAPRLVGITRLGVDIETVYPEGQYLFVGTRSGLYVFDAATPQQPRLLGHVQRAVSCDPMVVDGRWAYLTLRSGRSCGGGVDQLQIIDLQNLAQPTLAQSYPLSQPYGLDADSALLYVCDNGLRVFDTSQAPTVSQRDFFPVDAYDVQAQGSHLLVVGQSGLYQYRYQGSSLQLLSVLPITRR